MFADPVPRGADVVLVSNILHDWDVPANRELIGRFAAALAAAAGCWFTTRICTTRSMARCRSRLYSAALFSFTEGRAYSAAEYRAWLEGAGLLTGPSMPTLVHCGVLPAVRR